MTRGVAARPFVPPFPLVDAKLHPVAPRPETVPRPRLVELLARPGEPRVASLIAPPGYGKTTVLAQWAAREPRPLAWLTLDDLDNDPAVLVTYLIAAFDALRPMDGAIAAGLSGSSQRVLATAVPRLVSELHRWPQPAVLVLDDAHRLVDRACLDALTSFLNHLPAGFRVALSARTEPALPLAHLRAQQSLLEIGPEQLALDEHETAQLVAAAGYSLSPAEVRELTLRTEGWAAGIYLATLAGSQDAERAMAIGHVTGGDRYIAAYLRSELGRGLDDDDVTFLTRTSILERVEPSIAEAVSGQAAAGRRLARLARGNLLIQQVGPAGTTFRYHNLLRDFLQIELERREPAMSAELHRRAADWYGRAGNPDLAINHAGASGDADLAARYVLAAGLPAWQRGQATTLERWVQGFEPGVLRRLPPLAILVAWVLVLSGRADEAVRLVDIAERSTFDGPPGDGSASFESQLAMVRALLCRSGPNDMLANARLAVRLEGPGSPWLAQALLLEGAAHLLLGEQDAAEACLTESADVGARTGGVALVTLPFHASLRIVRGDWAGAERLLQEGRTVLERGHYEGFGVPLIVHAVEARTAMHRGDLAGAKEALVRAQLVRPMASYGAPWFSVHALLELARAYLAISDPSGAQVVLREAEQIVRKRPALGILTDQLLELRRRLASAASAIGGASTLTAAELRVLPLLPTYLSFQDIADRLMISRNTVKTHAMSIYGKLWASSRGEAVERAVELGLLEPYPGLEPLAGTTEVGQVDGSASKAR